MVYSRGIRHSKLSLFFLLLFLFLKGKRRLWKSPVVMMPEEDGFDSPIAEKKAKLQVFLIH